MSDKPIIFSAPMVQALLAGRKSQTRRLLKPQPDPRADIARSYCDGAAFSDGTFCKTRFEKGDRLYVREACKPIPASKPGGYFVPGSPFYGVEWFYRADGNCPLWADGKWRPSIHMPRWASRLTLTVTEARVQRLQEISEADAMAEGVAEVSAAWQDADEPATYPSFQAYGQDACFSGAGAARLSFMTLWNSLHGPDAWSANPWVVAVSFTVEQRNIDA